MMALTTDDLMAIHQLYAAYCHAVDDLDGKAFSACFTAEGSMTVGEETMSGRERLSRFAAEVPPGLRHVAANIHVEGDGDEARGRAHVLVFATAAGSPPSLMVTGRYRDTLRRLDGEWLFEERLFTSDA